MHVKVRWLTATTLFLALPGSCLVAGQAQAQVTVFAQDLAGFNAAAGNPPVSISFDDIAAGTDITGSTIAGVTLQGPGAPLIVAVGNDTVTPGGFSGVIDAATNKLFPTGGTNVLSPGGLTLGPANPTVENDDLTLVFSSPVSAFGFDHLSQSADGFSFTGIQVFDVNNVSLFAGTVPISNIGGIGGGAPGGADFWGIVSTQANIARIVIDEQDGDSAFPDANIGFDTFRYVAPTAPSAAIPEPGAGALAVTGLLPLLGIVARRRRA